jgi:hypothetical protein
MLEIRDPERARDFLLGGLWLARVASPTPETTAAALQSLLALASEGHAIPPLGFMADLGLLAIGTRDAPAPLAAHELPLVDPGLLRRYEDYCLGKLYADLSFERGCDAIVRYDAADRARGLAYIAERMLVRTGFAGVLLNPAAIRSLQQQPAVDVPQQAWEALAAAGPSALVLEQYESLIDCWKNTGDLLAPADILELERGTALAEFGQRLALRHVVRAAELLAETLPRQRPRASSQRRQTATHLLAEDAYPVGGFSSISTRGSIESLLHSQLVFLERGERPDLFDVKYVRDELLYYSRDENQFLRRRTALLIVLDSDLVACRTKDPSLPYQRIVFVLGLAVSLANTLRDWLSDESLEVHFLPLAEAGQSPLEDEQALLELLLADQIEHGSVRVASISRRELPDLADRLSRRSLVHCLHIAAGPADLSIPAESASTLQLLATGHQPRLLEANQPAFIPEEAGLEGWRQALQALLLRLL